MEFQIHFISQYALRDRTRDCGQSEAAVEIPNGWTFYRAKYGLNIGMPRISCPCAELSRAIFSSKGRISSQKLHFALIFEKMVAEQFWDALQVREPLKTARRYDQYSQKPISQQLSRGYFG